MKVQLITVGKIKEKYLKQGIEEYKKRLQPMAQIEITEITEEKGLEPLSKSEIEQIATKEGERIIRALTPDTYAIALAIHGVAFSSETLANHLHQLATYGRSRVAFIIGGSYGLSKPVMQRADFTLSFSKMTFPHQLMRLVLLEQVYRSFKINRGEPYHK